MSNRTTFDSSVAAAATTRVGADQATAVAVQGTLDASGVNQGWATVNTNNTNNATYATATMTAYKLQQAQRAANRAAEMAAADAAFNTLRSNGDLSPR